ncbi:MAG TPA: hypothetical protein VEP49_01580, partial [Acidimicrobiia bacterium]|nr:hypothetical protein [Acidimicrobiia bacterium]
MREPPSARVRERVRPRRARGYGDAAPARRRADAERHTRLGCVKWIRPGADFQGVTTEITGEVVARPDDEFEVRHSPTAVEPR